MLIKVDPAKKLMMDWNGILFTREEITSISWTPWMGLIMFCVPSSSITVLFNKDCLDEIQPTRDIPQGDLLSLISLSCVWILVDVLWMPVSMLRIQ